MKRLLKRCLFALLLFAAVGALLAAGIGAYVVIQGGRHMLTEQEAVREGPYECILVLGCGVYADGTPTPMLRDRLDMAAQLYAAGAAPKILVSGDHATKEYDEVNHMKDYLIQAGIPSEDIFMDHAGLSTYESMYRAQAVFQVSRPLIVTQKYHLYRAIYAARALGMDADGVPAAEVRYSGWQFRLLREILARDKEFFNCIVRPLPTVLGEPIPLQGSGDVTNDGGD